MRTLERTLTIALSALIGAGAATGCGDDDDGNGGGDVSTGIAPNKLLSDVTAEEAASACENLAAGFERVLSGDNLIQAICTLTGAAVADTPADCITFRDQCIQEANMQGSETMDELDSIEFDCEGQAMLGECTGTVGQLETCFNDILGVFESAFSQFSCDDAATVDEGDLEGFGGMFSEPPASCEAVGCPGGSPFEPDTAE